jgi:hypothetical protein
MVAAEINIYPLYRSLPSLRNIQLIVLLLVIRTPRDYQLQHRRNPLQTKLTSIRRLYTHGIDDYFRIDIW